MEKEQHVYEPCRGKEYSEIIRIRVGSQEHIQFYEEMKPVINEINDTYGHEWASSHNRQALLNRYNEIVHKTGNMPVHLVVPTLNYNFHAFKIAWFNYNEYLPKGN